MTAKPSPLPLPGYGLPINWTPAPCNRSEMEARMREGETVKSMFHGPRLFTNGWHLCANVPDDDIRMPLITLTEKEMLNFMDQTTDKAGWESYVTEEAAEHWHKEQRGELGWWDWSFSKETMDYIIQELRYKAKVFKETGLIPLYHGDVVKSDAAIPKELHERLKAAVIALEDDILATQKKERKGVVEIVDPDFSTVSFGYTRVIKDGVLDRETCLQRMKSGSRIPKESDYHTLLGSFWRTYTVEEVGGPPPRARRHEEYRTYSSAQWLPCDVDISGDVPRILTYINNLHPREYAPLYAILEEILAKVIPAWNMTLTPLRTFRFKRRIKFTAPDYGDIENWMEENGPKLEDFKDKKYPESAFKNAQEALYESKAHEFLRKPQVSESFKEPDPSSSVVDLKADYGDRGLQVIVHMRNIYLTPEEPMLSDCPDWHLEGIPNDHICAVAKYYYDIENVDTRNRLALAQPQKTSPSFDENKIWHTFKYNWLRTIFGVEDKKCAVRAAGSLDIPEGRLVTFPNLLFYAHSRLKLIDKTKNGHCKMLTLLLVDPNIRVISSAIVPCQQYEWWVKEVTADRGPLSALPYDLRMEVMTHIRKWWSQGTGYDKASREEDLIFKKRHAQARYRDLDDNSPDDEDLGR